MTRQGLFQLVFEGAENDSPDTLRALKGVLIADFEFSVDEVQAIFDKAPVCIKRARTRAELEPLHARLVKAGALVALVEPEDDDDRDDDWEDDDDDDDEFIIDLDLDPHEEHEDEELYSAEDRSAEGPGPKVYSIGDEEDSEEPHDVSDTEVDDLLQQLEQRTLVEREQADVKALVPSLSGQLSKPTEAADDSTATTTSSTQTKAEKIEPTATVKPEEQASKQARVSAPTVPPLGSYTRKQSQSTNDDLIDLSTLSQLESEVEFPDSPVDRSPPPGGPKRSTARQPSATPRKHAPTAPTSTPSAALHTAPSDFSALRVLAVAAVASTVILIAGIFAVRSPAHDPAQLGSLTDPATTIDSDETNRHKPTLAEQVTTFSERSEIEGLSITSEFEVLPSGLLNDVRITITTPPPPALTDQQIVDNVIPPPWLEKIVVENLRVTKPEGSAFQAIGVAKTFVEHQKVKNRLAADTVITGSIDLENRIVTARLLINFGFDTLPQNTSFALETRPDGEYSFYLGLDIKADKVIVAAPE